MWLKGWALLLIFCMNSSTLLPGPGAKEFDRELEFYKSCDIDFLGKINNADVQTPSRISDWPISLKKDDWVLGTALFPTKINLWFES